MYVWFLLLEYCVICWLYEKSAYFCPYDKKPSFPVLWDSYVMKQQDWIVDTLQKYWIQSVPNSQQYLL